MGKKIQLKRRDFLFTTTYTIGAVGLGAAITLSEALKQNSFMK